MRRLFQRRAPSLPTAPEASPSPVLPHGGDWGERLASVGRALDATGRELREVAVVTSGPDVLVAALSWTTGRYHDQWLAITHVVDPEVFRSPGHAPVRRDRAGAASWADRLGTVGALLDREPLPLGDACVVQLAGGFVVEALVQDPATEEWVLTSRGFATQAGGPG